ncbi:MAG: adenylate kinase [Oscillospiraceae bacterium]|jgi:adenylate kinase|nr:adenylate kinase [Oscillospiraceae bacterium]
MKLIMFGAPGAGKGTQAAILGQRLDVPTISTGNILRAAVKNGTPVGLQARSYMDAGKLVPDQVIIGIIAERLAEPDCQKGYILDGVPRTIAQAEALEEAGIQFDCVLDIEVPDQEILHRMIGRRSCPICGATYHLEAAPPKVEGKCDHCGNTLTQREDDKHETVISRLSTYHAQTEPLKKFYADRDILKVVPFQASIEATTQAIAGLLGI